jgi:L,D-transpeptidase catalytic domain
MSELTFDGHAHTITLRASNGQIIGTWPANNRTSSAATLQFVPNGSYAAQDTQQSHKHPDQTSDTTNGAYGSEGIVRFAVPGHDGIGIHSGRETTPDRTPQRGVGTDHVTEGCIRTTDEAMRNITEAMRQDNLTRVRVQNNRNQR